MFDATLKRSGAELSVGPEHYHVSALAGGNGVCVLLCLLHSVTERGKLTGSANIAPSWKGLLL